MRWAINHVQLVVLLAVMNSNARDNCVPNYGRTKLSNLSLSDYELGMALIKHA